MSVAEKRQYKRYHVAVKARWSSVLEGGAISGEGLITNLGLSGCYFESFMQSRPGQAIEVEIPLSDGRYLMLEGSVAYNLPPSGFGISFSYLSVEEVNALMKMVENSEEH